MSPEEALAESRERLAYWDGYEGGGYRALARLHQKGEIERQVAARLAARGLGPGERAKERKRGA